MTTLRLFIRPKYREGIHLRRKLRLFAVVIAVGFALFLLRMTHLQLVAGGEFKLLSEKNSIRLLPLKAPRGLVYGRRGSLVIGNRPSFTVAVIPAEASDPPAVLGRLAGFLDFDEQSALEQIKASRFAPFRQIVVAQDVSIEDAAAIEEYSIELPGVVITAEPRRRFPLGEKAAHALGYTAEIGPAALERMEERGYRIGDQIGKAGIELVAEEWLRGVDGGMQVQVYADAHPQVELDAAGRPAVRIDTAGRRLPMLGKKLPIAGKVVRTTIDAEIQKIVEERMEGYRGAAVVLAAETGAIRAITSMPSYDPNIFASDGTDSQRLDVLNDPAHPMLNRALRGYPPGSTFKAVMAYAALNEGVITANTRFKCLGSYKLGRRRFRCWKDAGHGELDVVQGLAYSCDVFFYNVGLELGIERIAGYARMFGFGRPTQIELPGEAGGIVPSAKWKSERFGRASDGRWYDGETLNTSIGQGYMLATPLQLARAYATVINGGRLMRPYLIESVSQPDGEGMLMKREPLAEGELKNAGALEIVREGLRQAIYSRKPFLGTGWRAKDSTTPLLGKTGTAQVATFKKRADTKEALGGVPYELRDHAWFVALIEETDEPLVIVVLCEHAGHASDSAVPIVSEIAGRIAGIGAENEAEPAGEVSG
jgi:penicillin-binding protein 2